jgi:hypothetical protein
LVVISTEYVLANIAVVNFDDVGRLPGIGDFRRVGVLADNIVSAGDVGQRGRLTGAVASH